MEHTPTPDFGPMKNLDDWRQWTQIECEQVLEVSIGENIARFRLA